MIQTILGILLLLLVIFVGFKVLRRIPKGAARRKPKSTSANQAASAPEESGDWLEATSFGAIPQLDFLVRASREGGEEAVSMVNVFGQMVEGAARTQGLQTADGLAEKIFDGGGTASQVVRAIEAAAGSAKSQKQTIRRTSVRRGTESNPYGVEE